MITVPMFKGNLIWDLNPGGVLNTDYSAASDTRWGFQYSTRTAVYSIIPKSAIVGEVFGTAGDAYVKPQYRIGVRWEPSPIFGGITATWSAAFDGSASGGFELGIIMYTPPFLCVGGCGLNK